MLNADKSLGISVQVGGAALPEVFDTVSGMMCVSIPIAHDPPDVVITSNLTVGLVASVMLSGDKAVQWTTAVPAGQTVKRSEPFPAASSIGLLQVRFFGAGRTGGPDDTLSLLYKLEPPTVAPFVTGGTTLCGES